MNSKNLNSLHRKQKRFHVAGRKIKRATIQIDETEIRSQEILTYIGTQLDKNMRIAEHIGEKDTNTTRNISKVIPNIGGPREGNRHILGSVVQSIITHGSTVWKKAINKNVYLNKLI